MDVRSVSDVAAMIRGRRRDLGLTQAALAQMIGASRKWVGELENGKVTAELGLVMRAFDALGLEVDVGAARRGRTDGIDLDEIIVEHGGDD